VALGITPDDPSLRVALQKVVQRGGDRTLSPRPSPLKDREQSLLVDGRGRMFGGRLRGLDGSDVSEMVAAELAGVMREAGRVTRMLALGAWRGLSVECGGSGALAHLAPPTDSTVLLLMGEPGMPVGRLALEAEAQAAAARRWLERYQ
jgi:predicted regulator of Ras-like GTPase activity (Roadblock/LC7/MglB family)